MSETDSPTGDTVPVYDEDGNVVSELAPGEGVVLEDGQSLDQPVDEPADQPAPSHDADPAPSADADATPDAPEATEPTADPEPADPDA